MSSFALKGFITGLAEGLSSNLAEERKQTKENLAFQLKNSYENMQKYNETVSAMQKDVMERDRRIRQFAPDLTEEQRIAAATMPDIIGVYEKLINQGVNVKFADLIKVGDRAKGGKFETWVSNLGQLEQAPSDQTGFVVSKDSFFTPSAERQQQMLTQMSSTLGVAPEKLARFKEMPMAPSLSGYGSFAPEFTAKLVNQKSIDQQLTDVRGRYAQVASEKGEDSSEAKELFDLNNKLTSYKKNLDPQEANWASTMNALKQQKYEAELAGNKSLIAEVDTKIAAALKAHAALTPKTEKDRQESVSSLRILANEAIGTHLRREFGELFLKKLLILQPDGGITYGGDKLDVQRRKAQIEIEATIKVLSPWINNGVPIDDRVKSVLIAKGVQFDDQGRVLMDVPPIIPRGEQSEKPSAAKQVPKPGTLRQSVPTNPISQAASGATQTPRVITEAQLETFRTRNNFTRDQAIQDLRRQGVTVSGAQ